MLHSIEHFLTMGGYAAYVWPAYLSGVVVLGLNILWTRRSRRRVHTQLRRQHESHA